MIPTVDYIRILPELVLSVTGIMIMLADPVLSPEGNKKILGFIALAGVVAGLMATVIQAQTYGDAFSNMVRVDTFSVFFHFVVLLIALVVILTSFEYLEVQRIRVGRVLRVDPVRHGRHDAHVIRGRTGSRLSRVGDLVHIDIYSGGNAT